MRSDTTETAAEIVAAHRSGTTTPNQTLARALARIKAYGDPALFITLADEANLRAQLAAIAGKSDLPLYGVPIAVKDNIDVAGFPTTAACPAFAYRPERDATAVAKLRAAGAIIIGKTNLDQFATGLVGVRSPYGVPRNPHNPELVPGGSSSGSAVAVAAGLVPLALGTDTAGSGRIPAGINNIVGLKPTLGIVSTAGVVPACRSLDCVSIFSLVVDDAWRALQVMSGVDPLDGYSRSIALGDIRGFPQPLRVGIPRREDLHFFGDAASEESFAAAVVLMRSLGAEIAELDLSAQLEAARLLYSGAWVAERTAAVGDFIARHPNETHPVTRQIIAAGENLSAVEAFRGFYKLNELKAKAREATRDIDVVVVPTVPRAYTVAELEADPIALNSNLGTYTNFINLFDLSGLAVPATIAANGTPYGVTLLGRMGEDAMLASVGRVFHFETQLPLGALSIPQSPLSPTTGASDRIEIAVVGAHLSGMALNRELTELGGLLVEAVRTSRDYRLFALEGSGVKRPGLLRVGAGQGSAIEAEIWSLSPDAFGRFVAAIPAPLSIGTLRFEKDRTAKGFLVEAEAVHGARDISALGGWRRFIAELKG